MKSRAVPYWNKPLAVLLCLILMVSLVPREALAEALDEMAPALETVETELPAEEPARGDESEDVGSLDAVDTTVSEPVPQDALPAEASDADAPEDALPAEDADTEAAAPEDALPNEDPALETSADPAAEDDAALETASSGTCGTVKWAITGDTLVLGSDGHGGTLQSNTGMSIYYYPWSDDTSIKYVRIREGVKLPEKSGYLFYGMTNLLAVYAYNSDNINNLDTSNAVNMEGMFQNCGKLALIEGIDSWNTSNVTRTSEMFYGCKSLTSLDLASWDLEQAESLSYMFYGCSKLADLKITNSISKNAGWLDYMFAGCGSLTSLDISSWDTYYVDDMSGMFKGCSSLKFISLASWDVRNVTKMQSMFQDCTSLRSVSFSAWETLEATNMSKMFSGCKSLKYFDVSDWRTERVTNMESMFSRCGLMPRVEMTWDTSRVANASNMFSGCNGLVMFKVGGYYNTALTGALPAATHSSGKWWSRGAKAWVTSQDIAYDRNYTTDTYYNREIKKFSFSDVAKSHWANKVIARGVELGIFSGYNNGKFGPTDKVQRGQVAVFLHNMAGKPAAESDAKSFSDVKAGAYYYDAVRWASSVGVVNGGKDGKFRPTDYVTREELAVMIANFREKEAYKSAPGDADDYASMSDASQVSSWAEKSVGFCFWTGIMTGSNGKLNPKGTATRAETAKMIVFLYNGVCN